MAPSIILGVLTACRPAAATPVEAPPVMADAPPPLPAGLYFRGYDTCGDCEDPTHAVLAGVFETAATAQGALARASESPAMANLDESDELADHHDALEELDLDEVVLSNERTSSVYRADLSLFGSAAGSDPGGDGLRYDEWDPRRRIHRHARRSQWARSA